MKSCRDSRYRKPKFFVKAQLRWAFTKNLGLIGICCIS